MTMMEEPGRPPQSQLCFEHEHYAERSLIAVTRHGGWDAKARALLPFRDVRALIADIDLDVGGLFVIDSLCAAYEAGVLTEDTDLASLFATTDDLEVVIEFLLNLDHEWLNERHRFLFLGLNVNDNEATPYEGISDWLRDNVLAETD